MYEKVVKLAIESLKSCGGWLYLAEQTQHYECDFQIDQASTSRVRTMCDTIAEQVLKSQKPILRHVNLSSDSENAEPETENQVFGLGVPVILGETFLGSLIIYRMQVEGEYSPAETAHLILFSEHIALILENVRLLRELDQRTTNLEDLNKLAQVFLDAEDIQSLTESLALHLNKMIQSDGCYIIFNGQNSPNSPSVVFAPMKLNPPLEPSHPGHLNIANKIIEARSPFFIANARNSAYLDPEICQKLSIQSGLAYPLIVAEREIGAALIIFNDEHYLDDQEMAICDQALHSFILAVDKIKIYEDEQRRQSSWEAIRQASIRLTSSLELEPVLDALLNQALTLVKADDAHIFLYEADQLTFAAARWSDGRPSKPYAAPRESGITYAVARSGKRIVSSDVNSHPLFQDWKWNGAIVSHPLQIDEAVVGVMNVAFENPHEFQEEELLVLELLAAQAAIALHNARLFRHINTDRHRIQLLLEVTNALVTELDEDSILQTAIDLIVNNLDASLGEAFLLDVSTGRLDLRALSGKSSHSIDELDSALDLYLGKGLEGWVAERKEPLAIPDLNHDARWLQAKDVSADFQSSFCVPIISEDDVLGVLTVLFTEQAETDQMDLLIAIGRQVGLALSNAYKYRQINRRVAELSALQEVAKVINSRVQMNQLLEEVVYQVHLVLGYELVAIYLVDGTNLHLGAAIGGDEYRLKTISLSEGIIGRVARTNEAAYVPDVSKDPDYLSSIPTSQVEIAVPLSRGDIVVGVLNVESPVRNNLNENDFRLLLLLSDQVSVAIENVSLYDHLREQAGRLEEIVNERTAELAEALENARIAERLKTQFVADVSHELRTPLANIRLYIELLSFGNPERFTEYLETLARETDRLVNLIEELLAISRLDSGASVPNPRPIDLNLLTSNLVEDRQRLINEKSLKVFLNLMDEFPLVEVDEQMIAQAVANLLTNAMHYTKPGGMITITTSLRQEQEQEWATLSILDTGIGIPPEEQERVFERFYRGVASRLMPVAGTGLGLAICKELIDLQNGKISMKSKVDQGSEFIIWLPIPAGLK